MNEPFDEQYLEWLYGQAASTRVRNPGRTYWSLMKQLYKTEFVWIVPNDDNRVEDGRDLRYEFMDEVRGLERDQVDPEWLGLGCSFLEMLIGLARRLSFETNKTSRFWFWRLLENIGLDSYTDDQCVEDVVDEITTTVIYRLYARDGHGGLFPLRETDKDQQKIELWYQASEYLLEE